MVKEEGVTFIFARLKRKVQRISRLKPEMGEVRQVKRQVLWFDKLTNRTNQTVKNGVNL